MTLQRNILVNFGTNGVVYFLQFLTTVVVSRLLTIEQVGLFTVSMAVAALIQALREFGTVSYLIQEKDLTDDKVQTAFAFAIVLGLLLGGLLLVGRTWLAAFYGSQEIETILFIMAISFFLSPFGLPATAMLRREREFGKLAIISVSGSAASLFVTCLLAWNGFGAQSQAYGVFASTFVLALGALYFRPSHLKLRPSFKAWRVVATYGSQASTASLIARFGITSPELIIGKVLGLNEAAIFTRGRVLTLIVERFTTAPIFGSTVPELAHRLRQNKDVSATLLRIAQVSMLLGCSVLAFMSANASQIIRVVYGPQWAESAQLFQVLCLCQAILLLNSVARIYLNATGAIRTILRNEVLSQSFLLFAVLVGAHFGLVMVCWLLVISSVFCISISWNSVLSRTGIEISRLLMALKLPLVAATTIYLSQFILNFILQLYFADDGIVSASLVLAFKLLVGASLGLLILKFSRHFLYELIVQNLCKLLLR